MKKQTVVTMYDERNGKIVDEQVFDAKSKLWNGCGGMLNCRSHKTTTYQNGTIWDYLISKAESGEYNKQYLDADMLKLFKMIQRIYKDTNIVYFRKSKTVLRPATLTDIANILEVSPKVAKEYLQRMIKLRILGKITVEIGDSKYETYAFNPVLVNTQKYVENSIYLLFKEDCDKHFPDWIIKKYGELNGDLEDAEDYQDF